MNYAKCALCSSKRVNKEEMLDTLTSAIRLPSQICCFFIHANYLDQNHITKLITLFIPPYGNCDYKNTIVVFCHS